MYLTGLCECLSLVDSILISVNSEFTEVSMGSWLEIIVSRARVVTVSETSYIWDMIAYNSSLIFLAGCTLPFKEQERGPVTI